MAGVAEAFVTLRPDTRGFASEAKRGIGGAFPAIAKAAVAGMAVVGGAIAATAVKGVRDFAAFEKGMNEVFTLLPGVSQKAMDSMSRDVRDFAVEMGTTTTEVVPALYQALSAGVPQDTVFDFLEVANKAAIGGITSLETAVDGISSVVNAYGEDVIDAAEASDLMFTAVRLGKTNFDELSASLFQVIPTAASLGVEFGDVTAALATMTAQGVPTSVATTQLRQAFVELSKDGGAAATVFEEMAGKTFSEFVSEGGRVDEALLLMADHAEDAGVGVGDLFGSVEAGQAVMALVKGDAEGFSAAIDEMGGAAGATGAAFEQMDQGLARSWEKIKVRFDEMLLTVGEKLAPTVETAATGALDAFEQFVIGWDRGTQDVHHSIEEFAAGNEDMATDSRKMGESVRETWDGLVAWWDENGQTIIDGARTVADAVTTLWEAASTVSERLHQAQATRMESQRQMNAAGAESWSRFTSSISESWSRFSGSTAESWSRFTSSLSDSWSRFTGSISESWARFTGSISESWSRFTTSLSESWARFASSVKGSVDDIVGFFTRLPGRIMGALEGLHTEMREFGAGVAEALLKGVKSIGSSIGDTVKGFFDIDLPSITLPWERGGPAPGDGAIPGGGSAIQRLSGFMRSTGIGHRVTSTVRPGDSGFHGQGRAVDFAGLRPGVNTPELRAIQRAFLPMAGNLKELIGPIASMNFKNGRPYPYPAATQRAHQNHVHTALATGAFFDKPTFLTAENPSSRGEWVLPDEKLRAAVREESGKTIRITLPQYLDSRHIATSEVFIDTFTSEIRRRTVHAGGQTPW